MKLISGPFCNICEMQIASSACRLQKKSPPLLPFGNGLKIAPTLILLPLLAFTPRGDRLGYGGGYYDRTLANLRAKTRAEGEIFACGVAYAGQEVDTLPTDDHDERLDGILTEDGFRRFT